MKPALGAACAAVLLLSGCSGSDAASVRTGTVARGSVAEVVEAAGSVTARAVSAVVSPADGTVASVAVKDGASVQAGQVLLRLSSPSAQQALSTALAANAVAGSTGAAGQALAGAQLQSARAAVDALTVRAPIAGVVTLGAGAPSGGGTDLSGLLGSLPSALQGAAGAALGGSAGGSAPAASTTTNDLSAGAPVGSGTPLLTVTDLSTFGLTAEVDETDVLLVKAGTTAEVELDAVPGTTYTATVTGVDLAPTTSTRGGVSYRVRLSLARPTPVPRPGMSAVVRLQVREATDVLSVPTAALVRDGDEAVVFVVRDGRARRQVVRTGAEGEDAVEVTEGLREGQRIVTRDAETLSDGDELDL